MPGSKINPAHRDNKLRIWLKKNWVIVITILISASGGVPGITSIWKETFKKPKFNFYRTDPLYSGLIQIGNEKKLIIVLGGTITNTGNTPLIPSIFKAELIADEEKSMAEMTLDLDSVNLNSTQ